MSKPNLVKDTVLTTQDNDVLLDISEFKRVTLGKLRTGWINPSFLKADRDVKMA